MTDKQLTYKMFKKLIDFFTVKTKELSDKAFAKREWNSNSWKRKKDGSVATLKQSGRLKRSRKWSQNIKENTVTITTIDYGKYHNEGTEKMPQRQFIGVDDKLEKEFNKFAEKVIHKTLDTYFENKIKNLKL